MSDTIANIPDTGNPAAPASLLKYRVHIAHLGLPDEQAEALLRAIWGIMRSAVDRTFGEDAAQLCRKVGDEDDLADDAGGVAVIEYDDTKTTTQTEGSLRVAFQRQAAYGSGKDQETS